jgi:hypothetical protein
LIEHGFTQTFQLGAAELNSEPSTTFMENAEKVTGDKALFVTCRLIGYISPLLVSRFLSFHPTPLFTPPLAQSWCFLAVHYAASRASVTAA